MSWVVRVIILPFVADWILGLLSQIRLDQEKAAEANEAVDKYENAKTEAERRAARKLLANL